MACGATLQADDGHDLCPTCLGPDHLREALSDSPCMNCSYMPRAERAARLARVSPQCGPDLPPTAEMVPRRSRRRGESAVAVAPPPRKRTKSDLGLSTRVEQLSAELAEMKSLFQSHRLDFSAPEPALSSPPMPALHAEEDVLSLAASASDFRDEDGAQSSHASESGSLSSTLSRVSESGDSSMQDVMRLALTRLHLEVPQAGDPVPDSAFFRCGRPPAPFSVPQSEEYLRELHACWRDPGAFSRLPSQSRVLAAMHDSSKAGLDRMPSVEPAVAALIVTPDEALRHEVRCPRPQCRITDDFLCRAYNAGARAGRLGNSLAHLLFALSASLQGDGGSADTVGFSDAALQAFALMTRELGRVMSFLVQARRQVWLAQSALTETCRRTLRRVPVEPGGLFGSAALEALERTIQARETRQQLSSLSRVMPPPQRPGRSSAGSGARPLSRARIGADRYSRAAHHRSDRRFREPAFRPTRRGRALEPGRRPPKAPRGRGERK